MPARQSIIDRLYFFTSERIKKMKKNLKTYFEASCNTQKFLLGRKNKIVICFVALFQTTLYVFRTKKQTKKIHEEYEELIKKE